jgi:hypothetical protein
MTHCAAALPRSMGYGYGYGYDAKPHTGNSYKCNYLPRTYFARGM